MPMVNLKTIIFAARILPEPGCVSSFGQPPFDFVILSSIVRLFICSFGPVVQWIEYLPAGRQGSFLNF
jgi:hypothetical protein